MRRLFRLLLLLPALIAPVVAASIVPDPSWIGGFFDGADGDEVAALVFDRSEAVAVPVVAPPALAGSTPLASNPDLCTLARTTRAALSRAPPALA